MEAKKTFDRFYSRLALEGMIKSTLFALIVAFSAVFVAAFVCWFVGFNGLYLCIGIFVAATAASIPAFYFGKFRPDSREIARRADRLGLEERLITMEELESDESYIALRQREDAKLSMKRVNAKHIRLRISKVAIVLVAFIGVLGISMTTFSVLAASGATRPGGEIYEEVVNPPVYLAVTYTAGEGGYIDGETDQLVLLGEDGAPVLAVADDGYMFKGWSDQVDDESVKPDPMRQDLQIEEEITVEALFEEVGEGDEDSEGDEGEGKESEEEKESDKNGDDQEEKPEDGEQQEGEQQDQQQQEPQDQDADSPEQDGPSGDGASGNGSDNSQIVDGDTYYRDLLDEFYNRAMEFLESGEDIPPELKEFIEEYYDIIL